MKRLLQLFSGEGLRARAMRGSTWTILSFGSSQILRLASNLILTRLLFPEAFGMMALVMVFLQGMVMFSDVGVGPAIMQSKRGDDPDFLNTAWTIQVFRGFCLWIFTCIIAIPLAQFYGEPQLAQLLPVAGFGLAIAGFNPTSLETANRHLLLGRVSVIDFATQLAGLVTAVIFALIFKSVWAFVLSGLVSVFCQYLMLRLYLPGIVNRFRWEKSAAKELITFGKWIFLSTVSGFLFLQGDKVVLGKYLSIDLLGIYNIGFFLASFPILLSTSVIHKILIPLYRERPPSESAANFRQMRIMRFGVTAAILASLAFFAFFGVWLVELLYDPRYWNAGGIVVVIACAQMPLAIVLTYDQAALASGDSRRFFVLAASKAVLLVGALIVGIQFFGLLGALVSQGVAIALVYPVVVWLAKRQGAWDPLHDLAYFLLSIPIAALAIWLNLDAVISLISLGAA